MDYMVLGLGVFLGVHCISLFSTVRNSIIEWIGLLTFRLIYSVMTIVGLYLIIEGWSSFPTWVFYEPPEHLKALNTILMLPAFVLCAIGVLPNNLKHNLPSPAVLAIILWASGHILANGDSRSLVLFGSIQIYAVTNYIVLLIRGQEKVLHTVSSGWDFGAFAVGAGTYVSFLVGHEWLFGFDPLLSSGF